MARLKRILISVCIVFMLPLLVSCNCVEKGDNEENYETLLDKVDFSDLYMPNLKDIGIYKEIKIYYKVTKKIFWNDVKSLSLIVNYSTEQYYVNKNKILEQYSFINQEKAELKDYKADVNGFHIQVVEDEQGISDDYTTFYCKRLFMIGFDDVNYQIIYLYHYDFDIDYIEDLDDYIKKYYKI